MPFNSRVRENAIHDSHKGINSRTVRCNSLFRKRFYHYAYGSVAAWMYGTAAGIKSDENAPAYKHFFISPIPDKRLGSAKAKIDTRSGSIMSEWYCEGDDVRYSFVIPEGTTATVTIDGKTEELGAGKYTRWGTIA